MAMVVVCKNGERKVPSKSMFGLVLHRLSDLVRDPADRNFYWRSPTVIAPQSGAQKAGSLYLEADMGAITNFV